MYCCIRSDHWMVDGLDGWEHFIYNTFKNPVQIFTYMVMVCILFSGHLTGGTTGTLPGEPQWSGY